MAYHYKRSEPDADMNHERISVIKELMTITEHSLQGWHERAKSICPNSAEKPEHALTIWYILCRIYENIENVISIMDFSRSFPGLYKESTIRKRLKDLRVEGVIRYVEHKFQISDEAICAIEEQIIKSYLNKYWLVANKAKSIGMIDEEFLKAATDSDNQDQHGGTSLLRPKGVIS
jgi:hypothetical protein